MAKRRVNRTGAAPKRRGKPPLKRRTGDNAGESPARQHAGHGRPARAVRLPKRRAKAPKPRAATPALPAGPAAPVMRIGHGYDLHRLEPREPAGRGRPMIVGGELFDDATFTLGPVGHSDGDVLYHAVTDALLGALALPDIGQLFPDNDSRNENRNSADFVSAAMARVRAAGFLVGNLDATVILERPKIGPRKDRIRGNIARLLGVAVECVNVKGKTHERVDAVGEGRAIEAHVVVVLVKG